jgi:hypothetical protein
MIPACELPQLDENNLVKMAWVWSLQGLQDRRQVHPEMQEPHSPGNGPIFHGVFQCEVGNDFFEITHFVLEVRDFAGCRLTCRITRKPLLAIRLWARTNGASKAHSMNSFDQV